MRDLGLVQRRELRRALFHGDMRRIDDAVACGPLRQFLAGDLPSFDLVERCGHVEKVRPLGFEREPGHVFMPMRGNEGAHIVVDDFRRRIRHADRVFRIRGADRQCRIRMALCRLHTSYCPFIAHDSHHIRLSPANGIAMAVLAASWLRTSRFAAYAHDYSVDNWWTAVDGCGYRLYIVFRYVANHEI